MASKGNWRDLIVGEPIDWAAVAERQKDPNWTRRGDKMPRWIVEKAKASRKANRERKQREALARRERQQERKPPPGPLDRNVYEKMLLAMEPGRWYGRRDIAMLSGVPKRSVKARTPPLVRAEILETRKNPDYKPEVVGSTAADGKRIGATEEPIWLLRLTGRGEELRGLVEARKARARFSHKVGVRVVLEEENA